MRPGPDRLPPGSSPGGIVVQIYTGTGELLSSTAIGPDDDANAAAVADANLAARATPLAAEVPIVLVAFDGDTGARWSPLDWLSNIGE